jgi:hypothetical protein
MKHAMGFALIVVALSRLAAAAEPSTAEDKARLVRTVKELEASPFSESATAERAWAVGFVEDAPDIIIEINVNYLKELLASTAPARDIMVGQFILGSAAFVVEHPELAEDHAASTEAAFLSMLRVYRKAVQRDPTNRVEFFDSLDESERKGELATFVNRLIAERPADKAAGQP